MFTKSNYWSCSKLADKLRGTNKPKAATAEGWDDWRIAAQTSNKFRYWLAEEGLDMAQNFVCWPSKKLYNIKYYINNRWITKTHALTASRKDIKPGVWHDLSHRILPCLFNELQDFVEIELAWWHVAWSDDDVKKKYNTPFWAYGWFKVRTWRSKQAGIDNLLWQSSLVHEKDHYPEGHENIGKHTLQAVNAKEILALYTWWTDTYRNRPSPYDASGWSAYCEASRKENGDAVSFLSSRNKTPELEKMCNDAHELLNKIEEDYEKEDTEMMIRLIKVRNSLWT